MSGLVHRRANSSKVVDDAGGGLVMDHADCFDFVICVCPQALGDTGRNDAGIPFRRNALGAQTGILDHPAPGFGKISGLWN